MSPKEIQIQRALGLLNDWIIVMGNREARKNRYYYNLYEQDNSAYYIVVEAISLQGALRQIAQSNLFPQNYFYIQCRWQSNKFGKYLRELSLRKDPYKNPSRLYIL